MMFRETFDKQALDVKATKEQTVVAGGRFDRDEPWFEPPYVSVAPSETTVEEPVVAD